jgi:hypothetical protein
MNKEDYKNLNEALALLQDYISNYGAKAEHYEILDKADAVLRGYVSCGGEV